MPRTTHTVKSLRAEAKAAYARGKGNKALKGYSKMKKAQLENLLGYGGVQQKRDVRFQHKKTAERISKLAPSAEAKLGGREAVLKAVKKAVNKTRTIAKKEGREPEQQELRAAALVAIRKEAGLIKGRNASKNLVLPTSENPTSPQKRTTEFAQKWSNAFDSVPSDLKAALKRFDEPDEITKDASTAYFEGGTGINMNGYTTPGQEKQDGVYRHEYGHHLDWEIGQNRIYHALSKLGIDSPSQLAKMSISQYLENTDKLKALGVSPRDIEDGYISSSRSGKLAVDHDNYDLVDLAISAEQEHVKSYNRLIKRYSQDLTVQTVLNGTKPTEGQKAFLGRYFAINNIREKISESLSKISATTGFTERLKHRHDHFLAAGDKVLQKRLDIYGQLYAHFKEKRTEDFSAPNWVPRILVAYKTKDPQLLAGLADEAFGGTANVSDLIGSITANRVGHGHADDYYKGDKGVSNRCTEAFANLVDLHGRGTPLAHSLAKTLAPSTYRFMKESIRV